MIVRPPGSTLVPSPTLFRSGDYYDDEDFDGGELDGLRRLYLNGGGIASDDGAIAIAAGACLGGGPDRKSTRLNSSHANISYAVFCLKKKKTCIAHLSTPSLH